MAQITFQCVVSNSIRPAHPLVVLRALDEIERETTDDRACGPGWFDSSYDLAQGLEVREGLPQDPSLNEWLSVCLLT